MATQYAAIKALIAKMFQEPSGVVNSALVDRVLEVASKMVFTARQVAVPGNAAVVMKFVAPVDLRFKAGMADCAAEAGVAATAETVLSLATDGGAAWGTITFDAAGTTGTFAAAADVEVPAGSLVTVTNQATADGTLADINISLVAFS